MLHRVHNKSDRTGLLIQEHDAEKKGILGGGGRFQGSLNRIR